MAVTFATKGTVTFKRKWKMTKNLEDQTAGEIGSATSGAQHTAAETAKTVPSAANEAPVDAIISEQNAQIEALTSATMALAESVGMSQAQSQRDTAFHAAIDSLKSASLAVRSNLASGQAVPGSQGQVDNRDCGGCSCVDSNCCTFDIYVVSIRALAMQNLEIADSVANPWAEMEIQMFAYLDNGVGAMIPSLFSTIGVRKLIQFPGVPVTIERLVGQVSVPNGQSKNVTVTVDALEVDSGLIERVTGGRDEEGTAKGTLTLNCCSCDDQLTEFDLNFTGGGQGGGTIGIKVVARRSC
jgi:hypothetical protein